MSDNGRRPLYPRRTAVHVGTQFTRLVCFGRLPTRLIPCSPQTFDVDLDTLEKSFKQLQKTVHPDLFGHRSSTEQALSAEASSNINIAYKILRNPVARAQYLLQLHGMDAIGESAGSVNVPPALLMEVMEGRELLEDDSPSNAPRIRALMEETADRIDALLKELSGHFASHQLQRACDVTVALQYFTKLQAEAQEWASHHHDQPALQPGHSDGHGHQHGSACGHGPGCDHAHHR